MHKEIKNLSELRQLGEDLARMSLGPPLCPVFFQGELGVGKTTLIQFLVESLPGSEEAEVSSPSFNLVNIYPTTPAVAHLDLYRVQDAGEEESLFEFLSSREHLVLVEWIDRLPSPYWPQSYIHVHLDFSGQGRQAGIAGHGDCRGD